MKGSGTHKEPLGHEHLRDECTGPIGDRVPFFSLHSLTQLRVRVTLTTSPYSDFKMSLLQTRDTHKHIVCMYVYRSAWEKDQ